MINVYAAINKNIDERMQSASGGIMTLLAKRAIETDGVVYGVENLVKRMKFVAINNKDDISKVRGSKYVKAYNFTWVFENIKKNIMENTFFMFVGTPCQVQAVRNLINKERYDNCLLVDFICHGVMNEKIYRKYIDWIEKKYKEPIKSITFRNKEKGWKTQKWGVTLDSGYIVKEDDVKVLRNIYYAHYAHEEACLKCKFTNVDRPGDITIGDLWGADKNKAIKDDDKGISVVIVNNTNGKNAFESISEDVWRKEIQLDDYMQPQLKEHIRTNIDERNLFISGLDRFGYIVKVMFDRSLYYRILRNIKIKTIKK